MTMEYDMKSMGSMGVRYDNQGTAYLGQIPEARIVITKEDELGRVLERKRILDLNPVTISVADLIELLVKQSDAGKVTNIIGHVQVRPSNPGERISLTDDGKVASEAE